MSEEEYFEEEFEEEAEAIIEEEGEEARPEGEMPLHELSKMTDIIDLIRRAIRGELGEEEYRSRLSELLTTKELSQAEATTRSAKKASKKGKKTSSKKPE